MLKYYCYGEEPKTVVLLHGFCENNTCFNKQVFFLQHHFKVITIDLPGFGLSDPETGITMATMAEKVKMVLAGLNIKNCIIIGHSMGGYVTLEFAKKFPDFTDGFGLIHSTATADTTEKKQKRKQTIHFIQNNGKQEFISNFFPSLFVEPTKKTEMLEEAIKQGMTSCTQGIIDAAKAMMKREKNCEVLANALVPVFFAIGKHDTLINEIDLMYQAQLPAISKICYLENSAHMGQVEEPDKLNNALLDYCNFVWQLK